MQPEDKRTMPKYLYLYLRNLSGANEVPGPEL